MTGTAVVVYPSVAYRYRDRWVMVIEIVATRSNGKWCIFRKAVDVVAD